MKDNLHKMKMFALIKRIIIISDIFCYISLINFLIVSTLYMMTDIHALFFIISTISIVILLFFRFKLDNLREVIKERYDKGKYF